MARKAATKVAKAVEVTAVEVTPVEEVKVVETSAAEVSEDVKVEEVKKAPAKKASTKKTTKKAAEENAVVEEKAVVEKKAPAKKAAKKETTITLEFGDYTANMNVVEEKVVAQFVAEGHKASEIKVLNIYAKPMENAAYYVINETETGRVDLF